MTERLMKTFVKDYQNKTDRKVRERCGTLSSFVGIACNVLLFLIKLTVGLVSHSISVISDAFNNLSDCFSCVVTLFGYKMAAKPADKEHPFGHGRMEYLTALTIAAVILVVGYELLKNSVEKILHPVEIVFSIPVLICLIASIAIKLWMSIFNTKLGHHVDSTVMLATAKDSRNDMVATSAAALGLILSAFTSLPMDGVMGAMVSLFVLYSGYGIVKDTVDELLGKPADKALTEEIKVLVTEHEKILGVHDLIIHDYGPGNTFGTCHAEVRADENVIVIHDIIDAIEHQIYEQLQVRMTIHMDPLETDNAQVNAARRLVQEAVAAIDEALSIHDFRLVPGDTHTNLIFDLVVPFDSTHTHAELKSRIDAALAKEPVQYFTVITFDTEYVE